MPVTVNHKIATTRTATAVHDVKLSSKGGVLYTVNGVVVGGINARGYFWRKLGVNPAKTGLNHLSDGRIAFEAK